MWMENFANKSLHVRISRENSKNAICPLANLAGGQLRNEKHHRRISVQTGLWAHSVQRAEQNVQKKQWEVSGAKCVWKAVRWTTHFNFAFANKINETLLKRPSKLKNGWSVSRPRLRNECTHCGIRATSEMLGAKEKHYQYWWISESCRSGRRKEWTSRKFWKFADFAKKMKNEKEFSICQSALNDKRISWKEVHWKELVKPLTASRWISGHLRSRPPKWSPCTCCPHSPGKPCGIATLSNWHHSLARRPRWCNLPVWTQQSAPCWCAPARWTGCPGQESSELPVHSRDQIAGRSRATAAAQEAERQEPV